MEKINKQELYVGNTFANYKDLSERLLGDIKPKTGKSKQLSLKELSLYCEYKQIGKRFKIEKVYDVPKIKEDKRTINGNNAIYKPYIRNIILCSFLDNDNDTWQISTSSLFVALGILTSGYFAYKKKTRNIYKEYGVDKNDMNNDIDIITQTLISRFTRIVVPTIRSMVRNNELASYQNDVYYTLINNEWKPDNDDIMCDLIKQSIDFVKDKYKDKKQLSTFQIFYCQNYNQQYSLKLQELMNNKHIKSYYKPHFITANERTRSLANPDTLADDKRELNKLFYERMFDIFADDKASLFDDNTTTFRKLLKDFLDKNSYDNEFVDMKMCAHKVA